MSLTIGTAPFGRRSGGSFNAAVQVDPDHGHVLYFEDSPRRVRGVFAGETIVDSTRAKLMHETGLLPVYYFPEEDVDADLLEATEHSTHCPFKGDASYWSVVVGDRMAENAAWHYPEPIDGAPPLAGYVAFYWKALDQWFEEDEEVFVHARDPYHRVDVIDSSRHVRVSVNGEVVAETTRPKLLFETGLPTRYYIPPADVRADALEPSDTTTRCPYKGIATYRSVIAGGEREDALVWTYVDPIRAAAEIAGQLAFFNERVDLEVDGVPQERPQTQWSRPAAAARSE
ncbi:MAG: hypothetical protein QOD76_2107 [Solirubrobacteraceae bacterium]|nr:hypothetical protein [Solirubrobacteraceae bacterium]